MAEPGPPVVSTGNFTATSGTRALPTGTAAGDLLIIVASSDTASTVPTYTATDFGSGTINDLVPYDTSAYSGATTTFQAWWKIAGSSEPASYTLGVSVSRLTVFTIIRYPAGTFDATTPFNQVSAAANDAGSANEPTLPSVTTTEDECAILRLIAWDESKTFSSLTPSHTNLYHQDLSGHDQRGDYKSQATAGSTGTAAYDLSSGTRWVGVTLAIQPPTGPATVTGTGAATLGITGAGSGTHTAPAGPFKLDSADAGGVVTLSNGDLTATKTGGTATWQTVRSVSGAYRSTGKHYFEVQSTGLHATLSEVAVGLADAATTVAGLALGDSASGTIGLRASTGEILLNGSAQATLGDWRGDASPVQVAVDLGADLAWFRRSGGNWNASGTADPATGAGGIDISGLASSLCPSVSVRRAGTADNATVNYGATAFNGTVPSGYSAWDTDPLVTGTGAATLGITGAGSGAHGVAGTASATLAITASGSGTFTNPPVTGAGAASLTLTASGTGATGVAGQGSATLALGASASGGHGVAGQGAATLDLTGSGTGTVALAAVTGTGSADLIIVGEGVGRYLGWMDADATPEVWTAQPATTETWTAQSRTPEAWTPASPASDPWTPADRTSETWT